MSRTKKGQKEPPAPRRTSARNAGPEAMDLEEVLGGPRVELSSESLKASEALFRGMMEQSPLPTEILSKTGDLLATNAAWARLWGLGDETQRARVMASYNMLADPQVAELGISRQVERAFAGEPVVLPLIEYDATRAADQLGLAGPTLRTAWVQSYLYPVRDEEGNVAFVVNTYVDLSDLKRAEREAHERRNALARVDRVTRMGQLSGAIAHELNQPLTGILSNAQAAELMLEGDQWERRDVAQALSAIAAECKRAGDLIRSLRDVYRGGETEFSPLDINDVVTSTLELLHSELIGHRHELACELGHSLPQVSGNLVQVQQVLLNLVTNAIEAMDGPAAWHGPIRVVTDLEAGGVRVRLEDGGPGIAPETLDRIFEPLETWKPEGTGMGLAISNLIIQAHGGRMFAENLLDGGARVGFVLPQLEGG